MKTKGFTLIELLVVIAIIGILSGLIVVSMNGATNSAKDARIKEDLYQMRNLAILYQSNNQTYGTSGSAVQGASANFSGATTDATALYNDLISAGLGSRTVVLNIGTNVFCMSINLNAGGYYCIDSTGATKSSATSTCATGNATACPD